MRRSVLRRLPAPALLVAPEPAARPGTSQYCSMPTRTLLNLILLAHGCSECPPSDGNNVEALSAQACLLGREVSSAWVRRGPHLINAGLNITTCSVEHGPWLLPPSALRSRRSALPVSARGPPARPPAPLPCVPPVRSARCKRPARAHGRLQDLNFAEALFRRVCLEEKASTCR